MQAPLMVVLFVVFLAIKTQAATKILSKTEIVTDNMCGKNSIKGPSKGSKGAVYVRWGHNSCPTGTKLVFSGYAGGAAYNRGGAANYLCLSPNPTISSDTRKYRSTGEVYGAEYQLDKLGGGNYGYHDYDVPCAVCQSVTNANSFMLSGRDICPKGWHVEYKGLLMSDHYTHKASQYVCVDSSMTRLPGTKHNHDGRLFYPVIAKCGSLKCPPYKEGQKLTCAVCTN